MELAISTPDFIDRLQKRLTAHFATQVEEVSGLTTALTKWEDNSLLENPSPDALKDHKAAVERLLLYCRLLSITTEQERFPDRDTANMLRATQRILEDKLRLWHGARMSQHESEQILSQCFPNES